LLEAYEDEHYPILPPDPVEAIKLIMEEKEFRKKGPFLILALKAGFPR
jgi:HTH-type transcriptional regulator/antitoxin HigA